MVRSTDEAVLACSPLGKIPFLRTPQGALCESQVIVDWLEAACPEPALVPSDPFEAAKVRELATFVDLHLELVARDLQPDPAEPVEDPDLRQPGGVGDEADRQPGLAQPVDRLARAGQHLVAEIHHPGEVEQNAFCHVSSPLGGA